MIDYRIEVVGGPFDNAPGMRWRDDGEHEPPELILLGVCPGDGLCKMPADCGRRKKKHTYFWLPSEKERPSRVTAYELSENFVEPHDEDARMVPGRAIYTIGGLQLPRARDASELVAAGSDSSALESV